MRGKQPERALRESTTPSWKASLLQNTIAGTFSAQIPHTVRAAFLVKCPVSSGYMPPPLPIEILDEFWIRFRSYELAYIGNKSNWTIFTSSLYFGSGKIVLAVLLAFAE